MNLIEARVVLFSALEGGDGFWINEIAKYGPTEVVKKVRTGGYQCIKSERSISKIGTQDPTELLKQIEESKSKFIYSEHPLWPIGLNDLAAPPIGLIVKGNLDSINVPALAIVGTRNPTNYGVRIAGDFAAGFVDRGWSVISGGAYGIDAAAHRGALIAEGATFAVLACGIDINYPAGHSQLFKDICEQGALITEVMPGVHAIPARFLTRNRLIAAISKSTLVVEAAFRSGSLRTARDAAEIFRPVMAIPGPISSPTSEGCHRLIGERAAEIVTSVADAVEFICLQ